MGRAWFAGKGLLIRIEGIFHGTALQGADGASAHGFSLPSGPVRAAVVAFGMRAYLGLRCCRRAALPG